MEPTGVLFGQQVCFSLTNLIIHMIAGESMRFITTLSIFVGTGRQSIGTKMEIQPTRCFNETSTAESRTHTQTPHADHMRTNPFGVTIWANATTPHAMYCTTTMTGQTFPSEVFRNLICFLTK